MNERITSLTVRDFRSIRGSITVALDAPFILVHGKNGAGKTSLLSALELALTGNLASSERMDPNFRRHLVHKGADDSYIGVSARGFGEASTKAEFQIQQSGSTGVALLGAELAEHFSERCYLGQATLGRLLEIYQPTNIASSASPLTRFVKELLGLDSLDALIAGLYDAGDIRRLRGNTNQYWEIRDRLPSVQKELERVQKEVDAALGQMQNLQANVREVVSLYWQDHSSLPDDQLREVLQSKSHVVLLQEIAKLRNEISALLEETNISDNLGAELGMIDRARNKASECARELNRWRDTTEKKLINTFQELEKYFSSLPSPVANRPEYARLAATAAVNSEIQRCEQTISYDEIAKRESGYAEAECERLRSLLGTIETKIASCTSSAAQLVQALSTLLPHVEHEECPVCNRNFSEISAVPLAEHISIQISSLSDSAVTLKNLSEQRSSTMELLSSVERDLSRTLARQLPIEMRQQLQVRLGKLREQHFALDSLAAEAQVGELKFIADAAARQLLASLLKYDRRAVSIRSMADSIAQRLRSDPVRPNEPLSSALQRFSEQAEDIEKNLIQKTSAAQTAGAIFREIELKRNVLLDTQRRHADLVTEMSDLTRRKIASDKVIDQAKDLLKIAQAERTAIVRQVFNQSLNYAWKELFIRLAPDEPFVPAFALPDSTKGGVDATLETVHRDGSKAGNPRAMLSAGNLNTAALTLFMALHLSTKCKLPWLVIDDPVQNMDDVHISQFAALLRAVSRQYNRQIIIAVHEKPLFDYLNLELSPSVKGESLITIELSRNSNGDTLANTKIIPWELDTALAA